MDREVLARYLADGLSLIEIGKLTDRDPSTVGYWVQKYDLVANGKQKYAPRGGITRDQLEPLVESGMTLQEIATALDRSVSTVRRWLARHGLDGNRRRGPRPRIPRSTIDAAVRSGSRNLTAWCPRHGETVHIIENSGRVRCRRCRMAAVAEWRRRVKRRLVQEAGGCCAVCGYDRCMAALEFHHLDPKTKEFALSVRGLTRSIARLRKEAAKCVLLCSNCHAEVEAGFLSVT